MADLPGLEEKERRFQIFKDNLSYKLGLNRFADLSNDEYRSTFLGTKTRSQKRKHKAATDGSSIRVDWTNLPPQLSSSSSSPSSPYESDDQLEGQLCQGRRCKKSKTVCRRTSSTRRCSSTPCPRPSSLLLVAPHYSASDPPSFTHPQLQIVWFWVSEKTQSIKASRSLSVKDHLCCKPVLLQVAITWQIVVGAITGVTPFVVARTEFSKRIILCFQRAEKKKKKSL
ncbi:hypothetical protein PRUPE_6G200300 [Prunus persica]|uniref:Cathepsin propeptide inhibitor domain-containing protein n=1 Tax=Prunus persica TaxID=3760 RepID=A0A251NT16_PRUPE|nr:hypothetical protein PRUPE_6G200300 [Prunus persica]